ncbi:MAG: glycosyltransferase family 4 protein [Anaerolineae bacterium]|nr:glycosyltransferase family 4 protein [Anaerolineae bacterium]
MTRKRCCIIRRSYYPAESHLRRNAETLVEAGYDVDVVCLRGPGESAREVVDGVAVYRLPMGTRRGGLPLYLAEYGGFFLLAAATVARLHLRHPYAVVEADSMPDALAFAGLVPRLAGARLILYLFESMPELWAQKQGVPMTHWMARLLRWQERASCAVADAVICCHEMARNVLVQHGVPEQKVTAVLNVPDERMFHRALRARERRGHELRLVQHGTITENYGIQVVLEAIRLLGPQHRVHFDIVGQGEYRPALEALARRLGVEEQVEFHGFVVRERLMKLLTQADIGVVPMLFEYQSPNKMFEFVALGVPVIASDRQTFRQHFSDDEVLYFRTGDAGDLARAIAWAIAHPRGMEERAGRAWERYQGYRWQVMKERYLGVYDLLLRQAGRGMS